MRIINEKDKKKENIISHFLINNEERHNSIIAPRRSGKTTAILDMIEQSRANLVIVVPHNVVSIDIYKHLLAENNIKHTILKEENKINKIKIKHRTVTFVCPDYEGEIETSKTTDWLFEEPEYNDEIIASIISNLEDYRRIFMIGTLATRKFTYVKGFHYYSKNKGFAKVVSLEELYKVGRMTQEAVNQIKEEMEPNLFELEFLCKL